MFSLRGQYAKAIVGGLIALLGGSLAMGADTKPKVVLAAYENTGLHTPRLTGVYDRILLGPLNSSTVNLEIRVLPGKNPGTAMRHYRGTSFCEMPSEIRYWIDDGYNESEFVQSFPINRARMHAFTRVNDKKINSYQDLSSPVGAVIGFGIPTYLQNWLEYRHATLIEVASIHQLAQMIRDKRIAVGIAYTPDMLSVLSQPNHGLHYNPNFMLVTVEDRIVCWKTADTQRWLFDINKRIKKSTENGQLQKMLGEYYLPP